MQKSRVYILYLFIFLPSLFSCSKDSGGSSAPVTHSITYQITSNNYKVFSNITYTDTIGVQVQTSAADSTSGWSKSFTTQYSQFTVQLQVQGQNSTSGTLKYQLSIYIDGTLKASQQDSAAKFNSFNTQVAALVQ